MNVNGRTNTASSAWLTGDGVIVKLQQDCVSGYYCKGLALAPVPAYLPLVLDQRVLPIKLS